MSVGFSSSYLHVFQVIITPATVNVNRLTTFRDRLKAGSIFSATGFDVTRCNITSDSHDSPLAIRFGDSTALDELTELKTPIPEERLRFRDHRELLGLANTNTHLPGKSSYYRFLLLISLTSALFRNYIRSCCKHIEGSCQRNYLAFPR